MSTSWVQVLCFSHLPMKLIIKWVVKISGENEKNIRIWLMTKIMTKTMRKDAKGHEWLRFSQVQLARAGGEGPIARVKDWVMSYL